MNNTMVGILVGLIAMATSGLVFPIALRFARKHGIVDHPNMRKLQRVPVPVFGGVVVFSGILVGGLALMALIPNRMLMIGIVAMSMMMMIGIWDDMKDISALLRFSIEIVLVTAFIFVTDVYIDDFHGMWGINELSPPIGIPLSIFIGVGIMNSVNLIDGVDGYSSGYGMLACIFLAIAFWSAWSPVMVCMTMVIIGALLPFFMHNVFGKKSRMFMGDGGTLMLGMILAVMTFYALSSKGRLCKLVEDGVCLPAFMLAVGCIPIFDTLRVMTMRVLRGNSPFKPDKTHLHHLFVDMGFSHLGTAMFILMINMLVVLMWLVAWKAGLSIDGQIYLVMALGIMVTFGFYKFMKMQQNSGPKDEDGFPEGSKLWQMMCKLGKKTHKEYGYYWKCIQRIMDGPLLGG